MILHKVIERRAFGTVNYGHMLVLVKYKRRTPGRKRNRQGGLTKLISYIGVKAA